jgi:hypothetical protein
LIKENIKWLFIYLFNITKAKYTLHCGLAITIVFVGELAVCRYTFLDMASVSITHIDTKFSQIYIVVNLEFENEVVLAARTWTQLKGF